MVKPTELVITVHYVVETEGCGSGDGGVYVKEGVRVEERGKGGGRECKAVR